MAVSLTITGPDEGSAGTLTATAGDNEITVSGGITALYLYIDDASNGTFGRDSADQVPLPSQNWTRVWGRPNRGDPSSGTVFVASASGTPTLYYRAE